MADPTNQPKTTMTFTGSVYGVAGTVEGDQIIHAPNAKLEPAIAELHQLIQILQQKHPNITPDQAPAIIQAEITQIQQTQPQRWAILQQNLLNRDRWLQGGKNAAVKVGEYYAQNSPIGIALVAFFEEYTAS